MIAVTIGVGDGWQELATIAAERMAAMTGLTVAVLREPEPDLVHPAWGKCRIMEKFPKHDSFLIFDADVLALRPWNPAAIYDSLGKEFCAVAEPLTVPVLDESMKHGFGPGRYFNSGVILCGRHHQPIFDRTLTMHPQCGQWLEQTALNIAVAETIPKAALLPWKFNSLAHGGDLRLIDPVRIVNIHYCGMHDPWKIIHLANLI